MKEKVIAVFDIGKTNKKLLLFDYNHKTGVKMLTDHFSLREDYYRSIDPDSEITEGLKERFSFSMTIFYC
jgi:hypothetical protein